MGTRIASRVIEDEACH